MERPHRRLPPDADLRRPPHGPRDLRLARGRYGRLRGRRTQQRREFADDGLREVQGQLRLLLPEGTRARSRGPRRGDGGREAQRRHAQGL